MTYDRVGVFLSRLKRVLRRGRWVNGSYPLPDYRKSPTFSGFLPVLALSRTSITLTLAHHEDGRKAGITPEKTLSDEPQPSRNDFFELTTVGMLLFCTPGNML